MNSPGGWQYLSLNSVIRCISFSPTPRGSIKPPIADPTSDQKALHLIEVEVASTGLNPFLYGAFGTLSSPILGGPGEDIILKDAGRPFLPLFGTFYGPNDRDAA